jgi:hypothetical protein
LVLAAGLAAAATNACNVPQQSLLLQSKHGDINHI